MVDSKKVETSAARLPSWIEGPSGRIPCTLSDLSMSGGELTLPADLALPERFTLSLTHDRKIQRACQIAWRRGDRVGICFIQVTTDVESRSVAAYV
jgi:hypothetical protein